MAFARAFSQCSPLRTFTHSHTPGPLVHHRLRSRGSSGVEDLYAGAVQSGVFGFGAAAVAAYRGMAAAPPLAHAMSSHTLSGRNSHAQSMDSVRPVPPQLRQRQQQQQQQQQQYLEEELPGCSCSAIDDHAGDGHAVSGLLVEPVVTGDGQPAGCVGQQPAQLDTGDLVLERQQQQHLAPVSPAACPPHSALAQPQLQPASERCHAASTPQHAAQPPGFQQSSEQCCTATTPQPPRSAAQPPEAEKLVPPAAAQPQPPYFTEEEEELILQTVVDKVQAVSMCGCMFMCMLCMGANSGDCSGQGGGSVGCMLQA